MKLIYGTNNPAKLRSMTSMLQGIDIQLESLASLGLSLTEAEENGKKPLDNAVAKAIEYYKQVQKPIFSCDSGLYFKGVEEYDQPGVFIKRIHGQDLSHEEMLIYYSKLACKYGGRLEACYKNSICLVMDEKTVYKYDGDDLNSDHFYIVDKPHNIYRDGFPLDSLAVEIKSGKYYYDLDQDLGKNIGVSGFKDFFVRVLGL